MKINKIVMALMLIGSNISFSMKNENTEKEFKNAIETGNINKVQELINDIDLEKCGTDAIGRAAFHNYKDIVDILIAAGVNVNVKDFVDTTPLERAASWNNLEMAKNLIKAGANVNFQESYYKYTALISIAEKGYTQMAQLLIASGADVNLKRRHNVNALLTASRNGFTDFVKLLLDNGADINQCGDKGNYSPLFEAAANYKKETTELLIRYGAEFIFDHHKQNPLRASRKAVNCPRNIINEIKKNDELKKLDLNYQNWKKNNRCYGDNIEIVLGEIVIKYQEEMVNKLMESKDFESAKNIVLTWPYIFSYKDNDDNNILHLLAKSNNFEIFKLMLSFRPQLITEINNDNLNPIQINPAIVNYFKENLVLDLKELKITESNQNTELKKRKREE